MNKLKLDLDALRVDSFGTSEPASARGTVRGAESLLLPDGGNSVDGSCKSCVTCQTVRTDPCLCDPFRPLGE